MKTKLIFTATIAVIALLFIWIFREDLTPESALALVISAVGNIVLLWKWINKKEEVFNLKEENKALRVMHKVELRKNQLNSNTMVTNAHLEILEGQAEWVRNYSGTHPEEAAQVIEQQITNINLLKGSTLNPSLTVPPPPPN